MVSTRRRTQEEDDPISDPQLGQQSDSDDEAPEEVSLATGKQTAAQRRQEEQEARKKLAADTKERRKRRQPSTKPVDDDQPAPAEQDSGDEDDQEEDMDFLPDDVVDAIAQGIDRRPLERRIVTDQLRSGIQKSMSKKIKKTKDREQGRRVGPVVVKVLGKNQDKKASKAAKAFLQERLMGGVKRSHEMLKPTQIGGRFVYGPGSR